MSFILDALKKLEKKRQQENIPDILTTHSDSQKPEKKKSPVWLYLFLAALLINAGILGVWLLSGTSREPTATASQMIDEKQHIVKSAVEARENNIADETVKIDTLPQPSADTVEAVKSAPVQSSQDTAVIAQPDKSIPVPAVEKPQQKQEIVASLNQPEETATDDVKENIPVAEPAVDEEEFIEDILPEKATAEEEAPFPEKEDQEEPVQTNDQTILSYGQLPAEIKKEIPKINIFGHIYSDSPSARMVNINGYVTREGEMVKDGLRVEEIQETSVVFSYQNFSFRVKAF